ncbi:hypothetical protein [Undibacterium danionis]|uniref:Uncharacterized protein n=1 Tax=Undibacterium danionis TaxID=1812100 RepID=A0ABV6ICS7_9BURK
MNDDAPNPASADANRLSAPSHDVENNDLKNNIGVEDAKSLVNDPQQKMSVDRKNNMSLRTAIRESQILLAYAAQNGTPLSESVIKVIVTSGSTYAQGVMTDDAETAFWLAFNTVAKAVAPVSVNSLESILDPDEMETRVVFGMRFKKISLARSAVQWYTMLAIGTLCALLTIQIYWLFGSKITADIQKISEKYTDASAKWEAAKLQTLNATAGTGAAAAASAPSATGDAVLSSGNVVQDASNLSLKAQVESLGFQKSSSYESLYVWSRIWAMFLPSPQTEIDNPPERKIYLNSILLQSSNLLLDALQRYLLPLLYGLLGTCVYVLRTLAAQITARTYSEAANVGFRIRLYLGTLGGMVFAWFVIPENSDGGIFKSLSPFALAFLAGYSVEILFAAMDRFLVAFTNKSS